MIIRIIATAFYLLLASTAYAGTLPPSSGPIRTTITTSAGSGTFNYAAAGFSSPPTLECTVENSSTTNAYVVQIASKSATQAVIDVLASTPPVLSGSILNLASIVVGQPFAPVSSTPNGIVVDCIAAMPTQ